MGLSSAVQWWKEWQLRILVLGSLGVQLYLAIFANTRKKHIRPLFRFSIWLAYLGGDALAIYALATLFNRQKKLQFKTGSHDLEVLWAPILLIHLGGQIFSISAHNIEDNELWRWHIVTAVSQSYWKFSDNRGHWTLEHNECEDIVIRSSIEKPFDESIILWHLATDFCFRHKDASLESDECAKPCQQISNYMMHLLFDNPEMLPSSRRVLSTAAYEELKDILQGDDVSFLDEKELTQEIIGKAEFAECGFIRDAWILAEELKQLGDEKKMWEIIKGVWIEMLCFSAGRCRGYLHAKSLGTGGEYLTVVSLVMSHAGLETFAERQQRVQLRLSKEERVRIARQRIEAERNQADAAASAEVQVVVSSS
ncbi:hypothetical protein OsI_35508 [Oryza sativa Indica Group]|uniref:DUF4220 domain-containing protein n=1 Tax=Oryza sativa subsp. indica TaxID=39946 RepID=B8BJN8_ORYSI|nr:hypothetical protein OsI_35508 [Oryza sativa Indica Group]